MRTKYPYLVYVVGVFVVWIVVFVIAWRLLDTVKFQRVLIFGSGFLIGVLAASLARKIYR